MKTGRRRWGAVALLLFPVLASALNVGIVADRYDETFARDRAALVTEVKQLAPVPSQILFPDTLQVEGGGDTGRTAAAIERLQKNTNVDMIVLLGTLAGDVALSKGAMQKPTVIPFAEGTGLRGIAPAGDGSGIRNVNYVLGHSAFGAALERHREIVPFEQASLLVDARVLALFPEMAARAAKQAKAQGVRLEVLPVAADGTCSVAEGSEAVLLGEMSGLAAAARTALMERLSREKLPVFSLGAEPGVGSGVLADLFVSDERLRRLRRSALNIVAIAQGGTAERQSVAFEAQSVLRIDMAVARALQISPPFRVLAQARLLHESAADGKAMDLVSAAETALKQNLYVIAGKLGVREGEESIDEVRSVLLPQLSAELLYTQRNGDNVYVEGGFYAEKSTDGALKLQQILFSEKALARLAVQQSLQKGRRAQQRGLELEVVRQATTAFLQTHVAKTLLDIRRENERLMQANLAMARQRVDAGMTDLSDVYQWESEIAVATQARLQAEAAVARAYEQLNRILHRPITDRYALAEVTLEDPALVISDSGLLGRISNAVSFERLNAFYVDEAQKVSPDLDAVEAQLSAQRRQYRSDRRAYWSPEIALYGEVTHVFDETRTPGAAFSLEDETNWMAGVSLSLPLFEGGGRSARAARSNLGVRRLEADRLERLSALEQRIRGDLHTLRAGYPAIALAQSAAASARKSYRLVRENYALGNRTLADLLVAQNAALSADFGAVNTRYRFLVDLMQLQYDSGRFDFFMNAEVRRDFIARLRHALVTPEAYPLKKETYE
ncbi:TolC family protein [Thiomicrolovo sp. ZZH C-3]